jgi:GH35 family endo-1,4-beta-xylanase
MKYDPSKVLGKFRSAAAETDARVKAGIEENRKGTMTLSFKDAEGRPCENVHVVLKQRSHRFKYGANLFMLDEIPDGAEKNEAYKARFAEAFNLATLPFYWKDLEPEQGKPRYAKGSPRVYRRPSPDLCVEWCEANGIEPKAHCLNYPAAYTCPDWARGDLQKEKVFLEKRFRELAERYAGRIPMWEVTNELLIAFRVGETAIFSAPDLVEWSFKTAERHFPANRLIINEDSDTAWKSWGTRSAYYLMVENALLKGCRIDGIGMQFHSFWGTDMDNVAKRAAERYDPQRLFDVMDTYALLGRPLQITETTIPAYSDDPGDEEVQAELVRELYRIWFSHRSMEAIIYWNLPDGYAYGTKPGDFSGGENVFHGGLCRFDLSPKPAYNVIRDLFGREWRTNIDREAPGGQFSFRGFYGAYSLEATSNGKTIATDFSLAPDGRTSLELTI